MGVAICAEEEATMERGLSAVIVKGIGAASTLISLGKLGCRQQLRMEAHGDECWMGVCSCRRAGTGAESAPTPGCR